MTFFLPQRGLYAVEATQIDHPITLCELADAANEKLTQVERQVLIELLARIDTKE